MEEQVTLPRGRPRDPMIDRLVLDATRELLVAKGLPGTTIQAVARLANVRANAIYRRWPTRDELIQEAVFSGFEEMDFTPSGELVADLEKFADLYRAALAKPEVFAAVPLLLQSLGAEQPRSETRVWRSTRPLFYALLAAAKDSEVDRAINPDDVFDLFVGAVLYRKQMNAMGIRVDAPDRIAELVRRAIAPYPVLA